MKGAVGIEASVADFQPGEVSLAQPLSGECAVRGCFRVRHADGVARL